VDIVSEYNFQLLEKI